MNSEQDGGAQMLERSTAVVVLSYVTPAPASTDTTTVLDDFELTERLPEQAYFWMPEWQQAEQEADEDIKAGRTRSFSTAEELIADLDSPEY